MSEQTEPVAQNEEQKTENSVPEKKEGQENGTDEAEPVVEPEPPKEMRAVVLAGYGGLKSVKILKKPEPTLNPGEVLIRVKACGLNFQDLMIRQGVIDSPPKCPFILGSECSGEIEQIGEGVEGFAVGDQVVALPQYKAWAELVAVPSKYVFKIPQGMTHQDAVAMTMNYAVAYILLFELGGLSKGKSLLVHSAGGGVGQAVAQLAKTIPDVTVLGVCSKSKHEALKATNNLIDHLLDSNNDYTAEVRKVFSAGVDIVLDCVCGEKCNRGYSILKPMGRYILYGSSNVVTGETKSFFSAARSWWQVDKVSPIKLFDENRTLSGFNLRRLMFQQEGTDYVATIVEKVFDLYKQGKIKPLIDSVWALEDIYDGMQKMHEHKNIGKIVLDPALEPKPKPATPAKGKSKEDKKKQLSEEKKDGDEKKEEVKEDEKIEEKKEEQLTNGEAAGDAESKEKVNSN